jgi:O-antigen/teichoic acid export membrane protein
MSDLSSQIHARLVDARRVARIFRLAPFDTTTAEGRSKERFRRASLSAVTSFGSKGIALLTTAISVPLTLGYLGSERFGVWMTLSAIVALLGFTDLGLGNSLLNGVAHAAGRDDRPLIRTNVSNGLVMLLAVAAGFGVLFAIAYDSIPWASIFNVQSTAALAEAGPAAAVLVVCFLVGMPASAYPQVRLGLQQGYVNSVFVAAGNIAALVLVIVAIQMELGLPWLILAMAGAETPRHPMGDRPHPAPGRPALPRPTARGRRRVHVE